MVWSRERTVKAARHLCSLLQLKMVLGKVGQERALEGVVESELMSECQEDL